MPIKKRSKVNAQFNMSSLTDIIFLLLIFFMLTSSVVAPNALNLKLPGTSQTKVVTQKNIDDVRITTSGSFALNGRSIDLATLDQELKRRSDGAKSDFSITISPNDETPTEYVVAVMDIALRYGINAILTTEKSR
ncbi:MAG: biopolymer transporter ExbD [Saprospiraceae bacterium]|nr:biopolymer transporter ExbD [Saprospiraceae bacterium]